MIRQFDRYYSLRTFVSFVVLLALAAAVLLFAPQRGQRLAPVAASMAAPTSLGTLTVEAPRDAALIQQHQQDVLWLARCIYSETKQPHEQELVAWVVRNRVETAYRGNRTYKEAVLDPWQFSAFNPGNPRRHYYLSLKRTSRPRGWQRALEIAESVVLAEEDVRPFEETVQHFYSERSMRRGRKPAWAHGRQPVRVADRKVDPRRFRFYAGVS